MIELTNSSAKYLDQKVDLTFKKIFSNHPDMLITGNLVSCQRFGSYNEVFAYDELDRLTHAAAGKLLATTVTYLPNGNINGMTDVGMYTYDDTDSPHAVRSVENFSGEISGAGVTTTFNDINKIVVINKGGSGNIYTMSLDYGPDRQRWRSVLDADGKILRSTVYMGDYEEVSEYGGPRCFYYLGDNVLAVRENNAVKYYNIFTDNLGSILSVMDETGNKVFDATYSAWGRQIVDKNTIGLHRGYCGHEILGEFQLINMNGRLYDPMIGRFLSPNNYVQLPDNSQSYNRYSYCLNNPLKYTDPSGEFLNLVFGGFIGGFLNWASHGFQFNAKGLGYFATGAVASAVSAGIASGMDVAMAGGNFWKGAAGLAHGVSSTGFIAGAATGASSGFAGGFILSAGNSWVDGHSFRNGLLSGMKSGGIGALSAGVTGGLIGGLDAIDNDVNFWTGNGTFNTTGAMACKGCLPKEIYIGGKIKAKYVGIFEDQNVFESELLGAYSPKGGYSGFTLPDIGIFVGDGVFTSRTINGRAMMQHEFGHVLQYRMVGFKDYYLIIAKKSLENCISDRILIYQLIVLFGLRLGQIIYQKNTLGKDGLDLKRIIS